MATSELEERGINVIRGLAMDAVQKAGSGHPGTPMALAPLAHVLWTRIMKYDAADAKWPDRDRFVLSAGHASMLLYALLYLTGYGLALDDIKNFRQWQSHTPGHPEIGCTPGVEVTTGPLGQGLANGVGIALAEANLRARFGPELTDYNVFAICSDGDFEEGISHEASSLAGHLGLGKLVYVYDNNHISIDGPTELSYSDDVPNRFASYGWHVVDLGEAANDCDALEAGLREGIAEKSRPSLIIVRSHIGYPSPKYTDTAHAHGQALGEEEVARVKEILGLPPETFYSPDDVLEFYRKAGVAHQAEHKAWKQTRDQIAVSDPNRVEAFNLCLEERGSANWETKLPVWSADEELATRTACSTTLDAILDVVPGLIGGGADITENTGTNIANAGVVGTHDFGGRQIHWGIREHAMGSIMNGMALAGGALPFGGTFLIFSDYMRPAVRLAAFSRAKVAFVWSHDSIGLGEDGPTHQPIEQIAALRAIPDLRVIRPADANETAAAWRVHINSEGPTALLLTRQKVPVLAGTAEHAIQGVAQGAYVLSPETGDLNLVLIGTGSETQLCVQAQQELQNKDVHARVISMPCQELFDALAPEDQAEVLPPGVPTLAIEAGSPQGWERYADDVIAIDRFGSSAPGAKVLAEYGFSVDNVVKQAMKLLALEENK